uniref:G-protein coupled receptors family 1 profile domain-containing protein n=1 Tax=Acrobeloides nanus TaxID=290746 RepID=A0A914CCA2_9BILA
AWWPLIMKEIRIVSDNGRVQGTYCGADTKLMAKSLFKWLGLADSLFSYAVPFSITLLTDMAVLVCRTQDNKKFKLLSSDNMDHGKGIKVTGSTRRQYQSFKIQSEESKRASAERRQHEIRRCLTIATVQLVLNLPNYMLQLVDEFVSLQSSNSLMYLVADAIFYLFYLSQFPMLAVYVHLLHGNMNKVRRQSKKALEKTCSTSLL